HTMERIIEVSKEVNLLFENILIVGNRFSEDLKKLLTERVENIKEGNVKFLGILPNDDEISKMNLVGENLLNLNNESKAYTVAKELFAEIL
ncbi:MAG: hypothetical protein ACFFD7_04355, partial [Candidatus Thorarchaeota archaeon]